MDIVHTFKDAHPVHGGIENHMMDLARLQAKHGHRVRILACEKDKMPSMSHHHGVRIQRFRRGIEFASIPLSFSLFSAIRAVQCDILHIHAPFPIAESAIFKARKHCSVVVTVHAEPSRGGALLPLYERMQRAALSRADAVIVTHPAMMDRPVASRLTVPIHMIPLGIELPPIPSTDTDERDERLVLFVGRFRHYKGLSFLLEAIRRLPDCRLVLIGDGPERDRVQDLANKLDIENRIECVGDVDDQVREQWLRRASLLVLPSVDRSEAFGLVLLEAMAHNLPVISTDVGTGTSWVNQHGQTGLVVAPRNAEALGSAIGQVLENRDMATRMGAAGRSRVEHHFNVSHMSQSVMHVYERLINPLS